MKRIALALCVGLALVVGAATATAGGNSDNAKKCQQGGWENLVRHDLTTFKNTGECVSYAAQGGALTAKPAPAPAVPVPGPVSVPAFGLDAATCSVTVPFTQGIDTFLYGVNGYSQYEPITHDVTVTGSLTGADGTAPQFWIGYQPQPGYSIANLDPPPWHFDFYNGDDVRDC